MRVFLDSNVIMQTLPRHFMIALGRAEIITPIYSPSIVHELEHVAARKNMLEDVATALVEVRLGAELGIDGALDDFDLPDPADRHVAAGACANQASTVLTYNLRDFPLRKLRNYGLTPKTPDQLCFELWPLHERAIRDALPIGTTRSQLRKGGLPRLSKLLADI